ncbi:MAG: hypothetical protein M1389_12130 [Chloroflexi bacterium]|nr:hypothetical protein [Chloroflexota bacterium]
MAKRRKTWVYVPPKLAKPTVPAALQVDVEAKTRELVESVLKPLHVKPPPDDERFNYIVDIGTKWYRSYFYLFATYRSPGPTALSPSFEAKFVRLEYTGANHFSLAFMRHTGQWIEVYSDLSVDQCLQAIKDDPFFIP